MISRFFIDRPIFATVLSVVITLIGGIALLFLPVAQYPRITPPGVAISISYPGASAQVVADTVGAPIEQQVNGVPGMIYMSSQSANDGTYTLTVTFDVGTDLRTALVMVQNRVALAMPLLPIEVQNQGITIRKKTPDLLMIVNFFSPDGRYDDIYLSNFATQYARDELLRVPGVSDITYLGQRDYSIRAWLDPQQLAARNLTATDVANAIRNQNLDAPAGRIGQPPTISARSSQLPITTLGRLTDPEQFGEIIVKADLGRINTATAGTVAPASGGTGTTLGLTPLPVSGSGSTGATPATNGNMTNQPGNSSNAPAIPGSTTNSTTGSSSSGGTASGGAASTGGAMAGGGATPNQMTGLPTNMNSASTNAGHGVLAGTTMGRGPGRPSAAIVRLRDVARIELGAQNYNQSCLFDGRPAVGLGCYQLPGTNALEVADRVRAKMEELKTRFPDGVDYRIGYDTTPYIRESVMDVVWTLVEAVALVGMVVLIFLQDWRAMILPMIDVPVSLIGTFAVMALFGFSLNNISLFGLVLAIGIVVDDAIVVLENIERLIATGLDVRTATIKAMEEVTGPIVAVALVLCAVFVPCAFVGGITGQFFRQFAVTIAVSTVISAINAVTMTPSRAVLIFKAEEQRQGDKETGSQGDTKQVIRREALPWWTFSILGGLLSVWLARKYLADEFPSLLVSLSPCLLVSSLPGVLIGGAIGWFIIRPVNAVLGWLFRGFNAGFDRMAGAYGWTIGKVLKVHLGVLVLYAGLLGLTYWVFQRAPTGFIPQQDQGRLIVNVQLPDGASLERTKQALAKIERITREDQGVRHTVAIAGLSFLLSANSPNFASMFVVLKPFDERRDPKMRDTAIMARLRKEWFRQVKEARVTVYGSSPIPGLGIAGGFKFIVQDRGDLGLPSLQKQTETLVRKLQAQPGLNNVGSQFRSNTPQLFLDIDRAKVASLGVSLNDVNQTLNMFLGSLYVNSFNALGRQWQVTAQVDGKFRNRIEGLNLFQVRNQWGQMVPLGTLVRVREIGGPIVVTRYNLYTAASVTGSIPTGSSTGDAIQTIEQTSHESLPLSMKADWTELMFMQKRAGQSGIYVFLLAIVCVFLALAALYESWSLPLAVILVVPLCLLCSVAGVLFSKRDVNIFVQIGLVVLVGLACKNAILIVEYAKQLHQEGRPCAEATEVASRLRLRPILMTSFAFIFGVIPLMIAAGAGAEMRRSLGTAVFSGMVGVTFFGIFLTPVFFYVIQGLGETQLLASGSLRRIASSIAGAFLGLICGYLLAQLEAVSVIWGVTIGPCVGFLIAVVASEINRRVRLPGKESIPGGPQT